ncbi:arsenate reductase/protein-tyrosine-phosphatase family protein [Raoultella terrigena]|jgi:protein-tyrosine phosphatase|uniref:arsenate reductase/protein-tyrosine-phosphatase family protein n=1 Tax=Raoultella terrigena TaxID=577 RepID=UPI000E0F1CE8|nr:protein tyrosine phosphatase [Raoultella terrigena]
MFNKILVVCVGNICRSPTGEALLKKYCNNKEISSAGIAALTGRDAAEMAKIVAAENRTEIVNHVAKQLTIELCQDNELILVMEKDHIDKVCQIAPEARGKIMLFGHWISQEIPDPYKRSKETFEQVYRILDSAAVAWSKKI